MLALKERFGGVFEGLGQIPSRDLRRLLKKLGDRAVKICLDGSFGDKEQMGY
jgi:hypothetical protein